MPGAGDEFFNKDPVIAKRALGLGAHGGEAFLDILTVPGHADTLAAAASAGLDHDRIANFFGNLHGVGGIGNLANMARHAGHIGRSRELLAFNLVAHGRDGGGIGADKDNTLILTALGKFGLFRQEAKAGVNGLRPRLLTGGNNLVGNQIGFGRRGRTDKYGLIGHFHGQATGIGFGIDHHRLDAHAPGRLDNANGDFAAIGDQDFGKHKRPCPVIELFDAKGLAAMAAVCKSLEPILGKIRQDFSYNRLSRPLRARTSPATNSICNLYTLATSN